tara:strand:- start:671 stop:1327 length:657 start_codon:yes stop_codon:yes gene_type:complete
MSPIDSALLEISRRQGQGERGLPLGGSTGAQEFTTPHGRFVSKRGNHPDHVRNEYQMNRLLDLLGVGVPDARLGQEGMITEFQEGRHYNPEKDRAHATRDFVPHALIANWDMLGMHNDNAIVLPDGSISYVDVGGAGKYRAQGAPKGSAFGSTVGELDTLREMNPYELGHITEQDIGRSYDTYGGQEAMSNAISQSIQDKQTQDILQQRAQDIARRVG